MTILESWEDQDGSTYAIVRYSRREQQRYLVKAYEAVWLDPHEELCSFAGGVGYRIAAYHTLEAARDFLLAGLLGGAEVWWERLAVSGQKRGGDR